MASLVKVQKTDIKSKELHTLLINIMKFSYSQIINHPDYKEKVQQAHFELAELMKSSKFKKDLASHVYNQLIRGKLEHYVVVIGNDYMLQVKYRKGSMIRFEITGTTVLLYEVPYISVPSIKDSDTLKDKEYEEIPDKKEESVQIQIK